MQLDIEGRIANGPQVVIDEWTGDEIMSVLFDFWLNTPHGNAGEKAMHIYKE